MQRLFIQNKLEIYANMMLPQNTLALICFDPTFVSFFVTKSKIYNISYHVQVFRIVTKQCGAMFVTCPCLLNYF